MSDKQILFQLNEFKAHGFGGAFVHPRPGLITEYLSEEWFARWRFALDTAKELGLKLYIYDENSYPSGFAGGHVSVLLPDCLATGASYTIITLDGTTFDENKATIKRSLRGNTPIAVFSCRESGGQIELMDDLTIYPECE